MAKTTTTTTYASHLRAARASFQQLPAEVGCCSDLAAAVCGWHDSEAAPHASAAIIAGERDYWQGT